MSIKYDDVDGLRPVANKQPEIHKAIDALNRSEKGLGEALGQLAERLGPVMKHPETPPSPDKAVQPKVKTNHSSVANRLYELDRQMSGLCERIQVLVERLEI